MSALSANLFLLCAKRLRRNLIELLSTNINTTKEKVRVLCFKGGV